MIHTHLTGVAEKDGAAAARCIEEEEIMVSWTTTMGHVGKSLQCGVCLEVLRAVLLLHPA